MARIGKDVTFDGSRKTIVDLFIKWLPLRPEVGVQDAPNLTFLNDNQLRIYGWNTDLADLKTRANNRGFTFNIDGDAPAEPIETPEPPPTQDEIDARNFAKIAFDNMKENEKARLMAIWETEYDNINTTPITFENVPKQDLKWLR